MSDFDFPLGIAAEEFFCNRVNERKQLLNNVHCNAHTVLISPRRYGKTSLAYKTIIESGLSYVTVDLYMAVSKKDIEEAILGGISQLINQINSNSNKVLDWIKNYIKNLQINLETSNQGFKIRLSSKNEKVSDNICEALKILEGILHKKKQKVILFIDEFQEIERVAINQGIEAAIRHVAQEAKMFNIIFSGSRRKLLQSMFNNRNKPLYRLCDEIHLGRIDELDYRKFIDQFAKKKWQKPFPEKSFLELIQLTERHPYYVNHLLRMVFTEKSLPKVADINEHWMNLANKKRNDLISETHLLTLTQKKLLVAIANGISHDLTGKEFLARADLSSASASRALNWLVAEDFIEKNDHQYRLIDPLLKFVLKQLRQI